MKKEQFDRIIAINDKINEFKQAMKEIGTDDYRTVILTYAVDLRGEYSIISHTSRKLLNDILRKHDKMIREEIEIEISKLVNEALEVS